jgi:diacylglycerol kinase (ATP)
VNIGFGGTVTYEARKIKRGRGLAVYLPAVLKTIFLSQAPRVTIEYDGQKAILKAAMIGIGNGAREGGGFFCTPHAQPDDGLFDVCIVQDISRMAMLSLIPSFMNGSHIERESVTMVQAKHIIISSPDDLIAHADGEMLCTEAHRLEFDLLPRQLQVLC